MIVVVDNKEKTPWQFDGYPVQTEISHLKEGDYSTKDILFAEKETGRKILRIERKASTAEISVNLGSKRNTFFNEMKRLSEYEMAVVICEFPIDHVTNFPKSSGIPKSKLKFVRMNGGFIAKSITQIYDNFGIPFIYSDSRESAEMKAYEFLYAYQSRI